MVRYSSSRRSGLFRWAAKPASRAVCATLDAVIEVSRIRGGAVAPCETRIARARSMPFMPGSFQSIRIRSKRRPSFAASASTSRARSASCTTVGRIRHVFAWCCNISLLFRLSSTISTSRSRRSSRVTQPAAAASATSRSAVNQKRDPCPGMLSTSMPPPIRVTNWREIASPSPVPPKRRVVELSACENAENSRARASSVMPMPVSTIENSSRLARLASSGEPSRAGRTSISTSPFSVNLTALPTRLVRTWRSRPASPRTAAGTASSIRHNSSMPLPCALPAAISATSSTSSRTSKSTGSSSILPASIFEKSRMSLMMLSSESAECRMFFA